MNLLRKLLLTLPFIVAAFPAMAGQTVLTSHPAAQALAAALAKGTDLEIRAIQPARLPASRLASFLSGRGRTEAEKAAQDGDAVVTLNSFWPGDPTYPALRRANIRIVQIDAAQPLDHGLPGMAIMPLQDGTALYAELGLQPMPPAGEETAPWLAPTRLGEMAEVLAADLSRLDPDAAEGIARNLATLKSRLLAAKARTDSALARAETVTVLSLSPRFVYLADDLGLELVATLTAAPNEWAADRSARLAGMIEELGARAVLLDTVPEPPLAEALATSRARVVVLSPGTSEEDLASVVEANLAALADALSEQH